MKPKTILLALSFAAMVAFGGNLLVKQFNQQPSVDYAQVFVIEQEVARGAVVAEGMVKPKQIPVEAVPVGALLKKEDVVGRTTAVRVTPGIVLTSHLAPKGTAPGLRGLIPKGKRAFTIHTPSDSAGVAGLIHPGDRVDVMLTIHDNGEYDGSTVTLLENMEILAVGQQIDPHAPKADAKKSTRTTNRGAQSVTLMTTSLDARKLTLGQSRGTLNLSLRNPDCDQTHEEEELSLSWNELLGRELAPQLDPKSVEGLANKARGDFDAVTAALEQQQPKPEPKPEPAAEPAPTIAAVAVKEEPEQPVAAPLPPIVTFRGSMRGYVPLRRAAEEQDDPRFNQHVAAAGNFSVPPPRPAK